MTASPKAACIRPSRGSSINLSKALFVTVLSLLCLFWAITVLGVEQPRQATLPGNPSGHADPTVDVLLVTSTRIETNAQFDEAIAEYIAVLADTEGLTAEYVELDSDECLARFGIKAANPMLWTEVRNVIKVIADANGVRYFLLLGGQMVVPRPLWDVTFQPGAPEPTESQARFISSDAWYVDFDSDAIVDNGFVVARLPDLGVGCDGVTQGLLTAIELHTAGGFSLDREVKFTSDGYTTPPYGVCATCWKHDEFLTLMSSSDYIIFAGHGTPLAFFNNSNDAKFTVGYMDSVDLQSFHPVVIGYYSCNTGNMQLDSPTLSSGFPAAGAAAFLARTTTDGVPTHVANEVHAGIFAGDRIGDALFRSMREAVLIYGNAFKAAAGHLILYGDPTLRRRVSAPAGFIGTYATGTGELLLRWRRSPVVDISHYTVHQGIEPDFTPSPDNRVAEPADTVITLHGISPTETWHIKVAAVNVYGNISSYVDLASVDVTVPTYVQSHEAVWIGNGVEITWALATDQTQLDFEIARKDGPDSDFERLDGPVLQDGESYSFFDGDARTGGAYVYRVGVVESGALVASFTTALDVPAVELTLDQNHPNPFNPSTTISFTLPSRMRAMLSVYDVRGKLVAIVADETAVGYREHKWDGKDVDGVPVSSGVYFYRLTVGKRTLTKKMVLLK